MMKFRKILETVVEIFIPIAGDVVENIKSKDGGVGRFLTPRFVKSVIRLLVALVTLYMVIKGDLDPDALNNM